MNWFTHFTRPPRKGLPPGGRNHVKRSAFRTLCGVPLQPWLKNGTVIIDALSRRPAYPDCKKCERLFREGCAAGPPRDGALAPWPVLG